MSKDIGRLFLAHRRELQAYLTKKLGNADIAADLTQETFLRFAEHSSSAAAAVITHERSYLYRTAHNLAVDHLRRERRERTYTVSDHDLGGALDDGRLAADAADSRDELAVVRAAIQELPARTRQVFALARIEGLTYREVAVRLRISESSVQKHLAKATKHVMQRLRLT